MTMREAWVEAGHGGSFRRASTGTTYTRCMSDKPGMPPAFDRFVEKNLDTIPQEDIEATDWELVSGE